MRRLSVVFLMFALASCAFAYDFEVDGIYYEYVGKGKDSVAVARGGYKKKYQGNVVIPSSVVYKKKRLVVCEIGSSAFSGCDGLTSVTIPNSVTTIEISAFENCRGLKSIIIPNSVTTIGSSAFSGCYGLTSVTIPNSVTTIGSSAFEFCFGLTSVTIPNSVTTIGSSAFEYCAGLTSVNIPASVFHIGDNPFRDCDRLEIVVDKDNKVYDSRDSCNAIIETNSNILISGSKNTKIPNGVTTIGSYAFSGCDGLTSVTIPNSVTTIGSSAFRYCDGLKSIIIPNSVTTIGESAFCSCDSLKSVIIPNSVTTIGEFAFGICDGLTSVILSNGSVDIDKYAFEGCKSLKHISVPKDFDLKRLNLPKEIEVTHTPIVFSEIAIDSIKYEGKAKDGEIRCNEKGNLYLLVRNSSPGKAKDAIAKITVSGATKGIEIPKEQKIGDLPQKQSIWVKIPIETTDQTIDGKINVKVVVRDDYGVKTNEKEIVIKTHKLPVPDLRIVSHMLLMDYDTVLSKAKTFELKVVLRNEGDAVARRHNVTATIPDGMILYSNGSIALPDIEPCEEDTLTFKLSSYDNIRDYVTLKFTILKSVKKRVESYDVDLQFNKTMTTPKNIIQNFIPKRVGIDSIAIVGSVVLQQYTSLELISNKWARYKSNHVVLKIKISGDKPETIRRAKELLNVNLGTQLGANGVHKGEPNEVWFLIPVEARRILLTCGDGCREIEIWKAELKNNCVYQGEIKVY